MNIEEANKKISDIKNRIVTNSKDSHFAKELIDELLSVKGQSMITETELDCGVKEKEISSNSFRIVITNKGILYHEYGGYNIFVTPNNRKLYGALAELVENFENDSKLEGEDKKTNENITSLILFCLSAPKTAFLDYKATYDIGTSVVKNINRIYEELINKPLQDETVLEDIDYKEAELAMEKIKKDA